MPPRNSTRGRPTADNPTDEGVNTSDRDNTRTFMTSMKNMMKEFMGEHKDILKTSHASTSSGRRTRSNIHRVRVLEEQEEIEKGATR